MIGYEADPADPADAGPVYHHGPELIPVVDLIVGTGLPLAAGLWLGRRRSVRARLTGGAGRATEAGPADGDASGSSDSVPPVRSAGEATLAQATGHAGRHPT